MTPLITLVTCAVFGLSGSGPAAMPQLALVALNASARPAGAAVDLPEIVVTAPRVPTDSVDVLMAKYRLARASYPLIRMMGGYGVIIVAGIFAMVWVIFIVAGMAEWPHEPRIPRERAHVHLHDMFQEQPVAVYDIRKKRLDTLRRRR